MPTYVITAPDGRKFKVSGDGTKEDALAHFQAQYKPDPVYMRNSAYAKQSPNGYQTKLAPPEEEEFQKWVAANNIPFKDSQSSDYDMRGFYKGLREGDPHAQSSVNQNDGKLHFSDYWKTPYHKTFSSESKWADKGAPSWNENDQLVLPNGDIVFDERNPISYETRQQIAADKKKYSPTEGMSGMQKFTTGVGKAFSDLGQGAQQYSAELGNAMGLGHILPNEFGDQRIQDTYQQTAERNQRDAPLMRGAGLAGNIAGNIAAAAPAMGVPGANTVAGAGIAGGIQSMLQPVESGGERVKNTAIGTALGSGSQYLGGKLVDYAADKLASRTANAAMQKSQNAVRDQTIAQGIGEGFVAPPATTNPTAGNRILESISGKAATQQAASEGNQALTNKLVRQDLGLAPDAPLTKETLSFVRKQAGKVYEQVKNSGRITADGQYMTDMSDIVQQNYAMQKAFPGAAQTDQAVENLVNTLNRQHFDAEGAVEMVKRLRSDSKVNFQGASINGDPAKQQLAQAQWEAAGALEDQIERHLQSIGQAPLMTAFREARQLIAKSHSAEMALNEGTGNIRASKLVQQLSKGKPLSGGFETIAKFASAVPKAMAEPTQSGGVSALTAMLAGGGAVGLGAPQLLALPVARYAARRAILTPAVQRRIALSNYRPSRTGTSALRGMQGLGQVATPLALGAYTAEQ